MIATWWPCLFVLLSHFSVYYFRLLPTSKHEFILFIVLASPAWPPRKGVRGRTLKREAAIKPRICFNGVRLALINVASFKGSRRPICPACSLRSTSAVQRSSALRPDLPCTHAVPLFKIACSLEPDIHVRIVLDRNVTGGNQVYRNTIATAASSSRGTF